MSIAAEKLVLKKDKTLLFFAKEIFGELVVNAWVSITDYGYSKTQLEESLNKKLYSENKDSFLEYNLLSFDGEEIVLEFSNGRKISFSSSELSSMQLLNDNNVKDIDELDRW